MSNTPTLKYGCNPARELYFTSIKTKNKLILDRTRDILISALKSYGPMEEKICNHICGQPCATNCQHISIVATGSDGRLEKGHMTSIELILLHKNTSQSTIRDLIEILNQLKSTYGELLINTDNIEDKSLHGEGEMSYAFRSRDRPFPQRLVDAVQIFGCDSLMAEAKVNLLREWLGRIGKSVKRSLLDKKKEYEYTMLTGKQMWCRTPIMNYDFETGEAYFYNIIDRVMVRSFKHGPLRFVQITLMNDIISLCRAIGRVNFDKAIDLLQKLPTPTVDKLRFLQDDGRLKFKYNELENVVDTYLYFLMLYHTSEDMARQGITTIKFDVEEARERARFLSRVFFNGILARKKGCIIV